MFWAYRTICFCNGLVQTASFPCPIDGKAEVHGVLADDREEWDDAAGLG